MMARDLNPDDLFTMITDLSNVLKEKREALIEKRQLTQEQLQELMKTVGKIRYAILGECLPGYHECGEGCCSDGLEIDLCEEKFVCHDRQKHTTPQG